MLGGEILERFVDEAPVCVMLRAALENCFAPEKLDAIFEQQAQVQYERELLFSSLVELMSLVVCRVHPSVHAAYQKKQHEATVSLKSFYNKLNGMEPTVCRGLVRHTAESVGQVMAGWPPAEPLLKGHQVKVIDGNHLTGTDHRLGVLRDEGGAALPGVAVAVLDPDRGLIEDVLVAEDAYTQEVKLCEPILERVQPRDVIIADRHYCTSDFLYGVAACQAGFVIRQHMGHLSWQPEGPRRYRGRGASGLIYEQPLKLTHPQSGAELLVRRITVELDQATRNSESELHLLTNLSSDVADAERVAQLYRQRWTVETAFQQVTTSLRCELDSLGYPPAALFSFCMAVACFNLFALILAALGSVHGQETVQEQVSLYYLTDELSGTYRGMMIAIPPSQWTCFQDLTATQLADQLNEWAQQVDLSSYRKHKRGPKKQNKRPYAGNKHVSTSRLLKNQQKPPTKEPKSTPSKG